jgi:hypothetical protein
MEGDKLFVLADNAGALEKLYSCLGKQVEGKGA